MKESKRLELLANKEENDLKAMRLLNNAMREEREKKFIDIFYSKLNELYIVHKRDNGSYSILTEEYDIIDFFPKANKLLIRKANKWIKPGLKWIVKNLLK